MQGKIDMKLDLKKSCLYRSKSKSNAGFSSTASILIFKEQMPFLVIRYIYFKNHQGHEIDVLIGLEEYKIRIDKFQKGFYRFWKEEIEEI
jgi:hypothetical protein